MNLQAGKNTHGDRLCGRFAKTHLNALEKKKQQEYKGKNTTQKVV